MLYVMQSDMKMQDATNLETTYTHACGCMYGMYYARWHEKNNGMNIMHCTLWHESKMDPCYVSNECRNVIYLKTMCMVPCMDEDQNMYVMHVCTSRGPYLYIDANMTQLKINYLIL